MPVEYADPTAILVGTWAPDQTVEAVVYSINQTNTEWQEVELRLRSTMTANSSTGYEVFFRCLKTSEGYAQIVRWNGPLGDWTSLIQTFGAQYGVQNGDVIKATIVGNVIKGYINGVEVITATDNTYTTGNPGIGFYNDPGNSFTDFGLTSFSAWSSPSYDNMANTYGTTGAMAHSQVISLPCSASYTYYTKCMDAAFIPNKNLIPTAHDFSIGAPAGGDVTAPVMSAAGPATGSSLVCTANPRPTLLQVTASDETPTVVAKYCQDGVSGCTSTTDYDTMAGTFGTKVGDNFSQSVNLACGQTVTFHYRAADGVTPTPNKSASSLSTTFTILGPIDPEVIQAESGTIVAPMVAVLDIEADGDYYIATTGEYGTATFTVVVAATGTYRIKTRVYASDSGSDSFTFQVDALDPDTYDLNPTADPNYFNVWFIDYVTMRGNGTYSAPQYDPYQVYLEAGNHTFVFTGREIGARLDYFALESVTEIIYPPTGLMIVGSGGTMLIGIGGTMIIE